MSSRTKLLGEQGENRPLDTGPDPHSPRLGARRASVLGTTAERVFQRVDTTTQMLLGMCGETALVLHPFPIPRIGVIQHVASLPSRRAAELCGLTKNFDVEIAKACFVATVAPCVCFKSAGSLFCT